LSGSRESLNDANWFPVSEARNSGHNYNRWSVNDEDVTKLNNLEENDSFCEYYDPYPQWSSKQELPIQRDEIESIFLQLMDMFGFQLDSTRNMYDYLLRLLDSRASRMSPTKALRTLHADYIGGINSNFKLWYFAAQLDIDDSFGFKNVKVGRTSRNGKKSILSFEQAETQWYTNMTKLSPTDCIVQLALYLLCWGEANNIRFLPECLCFIFKCCNDYYYSAPNDMPASSNCGTFLEHTITPLYEFYWNQSYSLKDGQYHHKSFDHSTTIGYDDMNQLFWHRQGLERLVLSDNKTRLMHLPPGERYPRLNEVLWKKAFYKTFKETRSWSHIVTNFSRVWILHIAIYWLYTMFNLPSLYCKDYKISLDNQPTNQARLTVLSIAGSLATIISLLATIFEFTFVPRKWAGTQSLLKRTIGLLVFLFLNTGPTVYLFTIYPLDVQTPSGLTISICQFLFSILTVIYLTTKPLGKCFDNSSSTTKHDFSANKVFTSNFHPLKGIAKVASYALWIAIFISKFVESYFFLTLSLRDPIRELSVMRLEFCAGEVWFGGRLCYYQGLILMILIYLTDLVLFCLDTYLWYIVWNTIFSVGRSFYVGVSIWTPWRNIFSNLPKRIYSKIIVASGAKKVKAKVLVSQIWNSVIISMYREHLLSLEHVQKLIYKEIVTPGSEMGSVLSEPLFFVSCEDQSVKSALFHERSEAQRRITFFAQSLSTPMPEIGAIQTVPCFTVLIPHYSEKIMLSLKEIIREENQLSNVTMLEYLKLLFPLEWSCFVKDTKMLAEEYDSDETITEQQGNQKSDIPYASVGFKIASPEYILRTRIWASLRTQTLYRTISGFMNYSRAIKLLLDVENSESSEILDEESRLEAAAVMAHRKFRIVTSMQRYNKFSSEEMENTEFLLRAYPELQISYLEEDIDSETGNINYYSVLIDGTCSINNDGSRRPKYRIKLSGNPILGDGKSDNQNHSIVFCRGEYIQLIDANQDNYIEECLKIRSILAEFEETSLPSDPYSKELVNKEYSHPVAIIGTREYIFSENFGILGDVAAGKEQTFGTLFARTLAEVGGKLHYGHPDFLNSIYMTTRGGVSKAQKGLHLNEDIYAGMNVLLRGGRIKQCEYMQCGKGRDLGFGSILNFTTKIGAGMGEQMISREYFYIGTQLPLDRFLSFYYAHPGFHLNNVFIIISLKLLLLVAINLAALTNGATICEYDKHRPITDPRRPSGCYNLVPVVHWLQRCIYSIFVVFMISFLPLGVQELTERGFYKMISRLGKQFASFSPLFEVFICRLYANSLSSDIAMGGAKYIATGRGLATVRVPFNILYSRYASESLYFGSVSALLILYASISMWRFYLLYFWITVLGLIICPFLFNPNQFSFVEFFFRLREVLKMVV
jgi:1,3-beta-glucan synthase